MSSAFSHAVAALSIGACFYRPQVPKRVWVAGAVCSVLPDLDVMGFDLVFVMATFGVIVDLRIRWSSPLFWQVWSLLHCSGLEHLGSGDLPCSGICF